MTQNLDVVFKFGCIYSKTRREYPIEASYMHLKILLSGLWHGYSYVKDSPVAKLYELTLCI